MKIKILFGACLAALTLGASASQNQNMPSNNQPMTKEQVAAYNAAHPELDPSYKPPLTGSINPPDGKNPVNGALSPNKQTMQFNGLKKGGNYGGVPDALNFAKKNLPRECSPAEYHAGRTTCYMCDPDVPNIVVDDTTLLNANTRKNAIYIGSFSSNFYNGTYHDALDYMPPNSKAGNSLLSPMGHYPPKLDDMGNPLDPDDKDSHKAQPIGSVNNGGNHASNGKELAAAGVSRPRLMNIGANSHDEEHNLSGLGGTPLGSQPPKPHLNNIGMNNPPQPTLNPPKPRMPSFKRDEQEDRKILLRGYNLQGMDEFVTGINKRTMCEMIKPNGYNQNPEKWDPKDESNWNMAGKGIMALAGMKIMGDEFKKNQGNPKGSRGQQNGGMSGGAGGASFSPIAAEMFACLEYYTNTNTSQCGGDHLKSNKSPMISMKCQMPMNQYYQTYISEIMCGYAACDGYYDGYFKPGTIAMRQLLLMTNPYIIYGQTLPQSMRIAMQRPMMCTSS